MLIAAVNPYEFHARSIGLYAALTVADGVVAALPDAASAGVHPEDAPRLVEAVGSWAWSAPLWRAGVLGRHVEGAQPEHDVESVYREIAAREDWSALRPLVHADLRADPTRHMEAVVRDLTHGGINPGLSIPVACGFERFAARHGLLLFRSPGTSKTTKLEESRTTTVARLSVPILEGVEGAMLLRVREALEAELVSLRAALGEVLAIATTAGAEPADVRDAQEALLAPAASMVHAAFDERRQSLVEEAEHEGDRCRVRHVTLTLCTGEPDGVLRAAAEAARVLTGPAGQLPERDEKMGKGDALGGRTVLMCRASVRRLVESA